MMKAFLLAAAVTLTAVSAQAQMVGLSKSVPTIWQLRIEGINRGRRQKPKVEWREDKQDLG
jgi:hypothetical protein